MSRIVSIVLAVLMVFAVSAACAEQLVFDHSMELNYAKCFSVDYYEDGYKMATISDGTVIVVVPEGKSIPEELPEGAIVMQQPINNLLVSSTPVTSLINAAGALDTISQTTYDVSSWYIQDVIDAMNDGKIAYIGSYKEPDFEQITAAGIENAFFSTMLTEDVAEKLAQLGVSVVLDQSASEDHPLARVEWIKLYGALFNCEEQAEEVFNTQKAYIDELNAMEKTGKSVAVFYITSKGVLYARNSEDYMVKMVEIAGGDYSLKGIGEGMTGTAKMELEAFYDAAKDSDYVIYIWSMGGKPANMEEFISRAPILSDIKAVAEGKVWCTTADFFQIQNTIGSMINDIRLMLEADEDTDTLTYLFKLK